MIQTDYKVNNNIAILDDHGFYGMGLRQVLQKSEDYEKSEILIFKSIDEYLNAPSSVFKVVILDTSMKDADPINIFEQLNNDTSDAKILLLVKEVDPDKISSYIDAGIKGIIKKDCEPDEVLHAIKMLISGKRYFDSDILYEYLKRAGQVKKVPMPEDLVLDQTDMQMIKLIADEYTQVEMNKILELPTSTIMYLRRRLFAKMNVKNTAGLMKKVVQYGLIE